MKEFLLALLGFATWDLIKYAYKKITNKKLK